MTALRDLPVHPAARALAARWKRMPSVGIITGSGFTYRAQGAVLDTIAYSDLPGLHPSSVQGHASQMHLIETGGKLVMLCSGRLHAYEGHSEDECMQLVSLMYGLGLRTLIMTNASGGLHWRYSAGDVALVTDTIDLTFRGPITNIAATSGDGHTARAPLLRRILDRCAHDGLDLEAGTYCQVSGPSYETRAEIRMLRKIGAELVGMSTVREMRFAESLGMRAVAFSMVTNTTTDTMQRPVSHQEVLEIASASARRLSNIINCCLQMDLT